MSSVQLHFKNGFLHAEQRQALLHSALQATLHHTGQLRRGLRRGSTQEQMGDHELQQLHEPVADRGLERRSLILQVLPFIPAASHPALLVTLGFNTIWTLFPRCSLKCSR